MLEQSFNDWTFGVFLLVSAVIGMWVVPAYNRMVDKLGDNSKKLDN